MTKESPEPPGVAFSAFAGELLLRVYENFNDAGAFGRFAQKLIIGCLRPGFLDLHENTGAGTPDAHARAGNQGWAWEVKTTYGGTVNLGPRDLEGLRTEGALANGTARVIVLDVAFPARLWVLDGAHLGLGSLDAGSQHPAQRADEARGLAECMEKVLRLGDADLIANEAESKQWLDKCLIHRGYQQVLASRKC